MASDENGHTGTKTLTYTEYLVHRRLLDYGYFIPNELVTSDAYVAMLRGIIGDVTVSNAIRN